MTFTEQYKRPEWQRKRLEVLEANDFECENCGAREEELHVHHPIYRRGAMIWEYEAEELKCLCHQCHKEAHALDEAIKAALAKCPEKEMVLGFIQMVTAKSEAYAGPARVSLESYEECTGAICALAPEKWGEFTAIRGRLDDVLAEGCGDAVILERIGENCRTFRFTA